MCTHECVSRGGNNMTIFISVMRYPPKFSLETNLRYMILFPMSQAIYYALQPVPIGGPLEYPFIYRSMDEQTTPPPKKLSDRLD